MNNEYNIATSTKRARSDNNTCIPLAPALKRTRKEARSTNLFRVKWRQNDNPNQNPGKTQAKMAKRLEPIHGLLASLLKPIACQMEKLAVSILSQVIEVIHCERRTHFHEKTPSFFPSSIRFEFDVTIKKEFESNKEFIDLKSKAKEIIDETKDSLRATIISYQKIEEKGAKDKVLSKFIEELRLVFTNYSGYIRTSLKKLCPPYDNDAASELLLQQFFNNHCANNIEYYKFLHIDKKEIMKIMDKQRKRINFLYKNTNSTESIIQSNAFIMHVENNFFPHINEVSFELVEKYILACDEEEALAVCDAMQKIESQRSITKETCDALTQEKSIDPPLMTSLIDYRVALQLAKK